MRHAVVVIAMIAAAGCGDPSPTAAADPSPPAPPPAVPRDGGAAPTAPTAPAAPSHAIVPCAEDPAPVAAPSHDKLTLTRAKFADLPGWADDHHAEAVGSFLRSCEALAKLRDGDPVGADGHGGVARQWRRACAAAAKLPRGDDKAARAMFEAEFVPWVAAGKAGPNGKMTGYYVQELHASRTRKGKYQTPVYGRPADLVEIELASFIRDAHGRRIWGRLDARGKLQPFYTREEIRKGALAGRKLELLYVDEPIDLLFAHIEGSAKATLDDGSVVWLEFAGKNGRNYRGVGAILRGLGAFKKPGDGTMQGIRRWFEGHRAQWNDVVDQMHSFVFFAESKLPGAVGSQMVILTGRRSMAVDRAFIAHSTPIWVDTRAPVPGTHTSAPWRHLLIAQDTGGGIKGAVRGDIYWGDDAAAADIAGRMGGPGRYWLLLPRGVTK